MPDTFDAIRPYYDHEVSEALQQFKDHPMIKALLHFSFPDKHRNEVEKILDECHSIQDFQSKVIYHAVANIIEKSTESFTTEGFDKLDANTPYLFISNHRDIVLDTSLLNFKLLEHQFIMTTSAIGDNLVGKSFLLALSKLNRNFLIQRGLSPREMLISSKLASNYIKQQLTSENRSVWIAQREGRTKDGNDKTQQGVLKMLALSKGKEELIDFFKKLRIVPVSISYEYDPTDVLKMPELIAKQKDEIYKKTNNEDFNSILRGALGQKKRIHITLGDELTQELDIVKKAQLSPNKKIQEIAELIDKKIYKNYKLWPTNYIAYDLLHQSGTFKYKYSEREKRQFELRVGTSIGKNGEAARSNFLAMYANPVKNYLEHFGS